MGPKDLKTLICSLYESKNKRPLFIWGPPGCGKSAIVRQACQDLEIEHLDIRLPYCEPGDIKFPVVVNGKLKWVNSMFPEDQKFRGVATLEELPQSTPIVQSSIMQAVLDRRVGESVISPGCMFIACGNRITDRAGAGRVLTPVLNRFIHIDLETSVNDWTEWASQSGIHPMVSAFINWKPDLLHKFDPERGDREFPTHRSWEFVSDVFPHIPEEGMRFTVVKGCVGEGAASEFISFVQVYESLSVKYPMAKILSKPDTTAVPPVTEGSITWALAGAIAEKAKEKKREITHPLMTYACRMPVEFAIYAVRGIIKNGGGVHALTAPGAGKFLSENKVLFDLAKADN